MRGYERVREGKGRYGRLIEAMRGYERVREGKGG